MDTKELSEIIARRVVEILKEQGYLDRVARKDNLTDIAQNLPAMTPNNGSGANEPSQPSGTVIASDGTIVTLGQEGGKKPRLYSPPEQT